MNNAVKYGLLAVAAYLAYKWYLQQQAAAAPLAVDVAPTTALVPAAAVTPKNGKVTKAALQARAAAGMPANWDGKATGDQWNWFYTDLSGVVQTTEVWHGASAFPVDNRGLLMTVDEYWQRRTAAGLSGVGLGAYPDWTVWLT